MAAAVRARSVFAFILFLAGTARAESLASALQGRIFDQTRAPIAGAQITARRGSVTLPAAFSDARGEFILALDAGAYTIEIAADGFTRWETPVTVADSGLRLADIILEVAPVKAAVTVSETAAYQPDVVRSGTKTLTPLRDLPQSISVVTRDLIQDQMMLSIGDVARYVPGVTAVQGENNRDAVVIRGQSSTADFYINGVRDDVQYFRDLYNIERVEALKGPNAMIFGRGGSGGIINRVTKQPAWDIVRELELHVGGWDKRRLTADVGQGINDAVAFRVNVLAEDSGSFRDDVSAERWGVNPTLAIAPGEDTTIVLGLERFHDDRTADRGISSRNGRPLDVDRSTFFGDPARSESVADVEAFDATVTHDIGENTSLRNRTRAARYDKFYQNVFPGAVNAAGTSVAISAYNNRTERSNLFNQTDLVFSLDGGGWQHTLLLGAEFGRQETDNLRTTGTFNGTAATSVQVPLSNPRFDGPIVFAPSTSDANNHGVARNAAVYVQDQIAFSPRWQAVLGLRYDAFEVDLTNNRTGGELRAEDDVVSPRVGLVFKPRADVSLYASASRSFLPRSGEQLASLSLTNAALEPETFENLELGLKWNLRPELMLSAAVYQLDRGNVAVLDPTDPQNTRLILMEGDAQRVRGAEFGLAGQVTRRWSMIAAAAWQDGETLQEIKTSTSASGILPAGRVLAQLPRRTFSWWNRIDFGDRWGAGLGLVSRSAMYASTSNSVTLPGYLRADAALYYRANERVRVQLNVENLGDTRYHASAHSDSNISPGSPRAWNLGLFLDF
jgi:catecholate siderophore receptor